MPDGIQPSLLCNCCLNELILFILLIFYIIIYMAIKIIVIIIKSLCHTGAIFKANSPKSTKSTKNPIARWSFQ